MMRPSLVESEYDTDVLLLKKLGKEQLMRASAVKLSKQLSVPGLSDAVRS